MFCAQKAGPCSLVAMAESAMAVLVRQADVADAGAIASSHVRSWQAGYEGLIRGDFLRGLDMDLPQRTTRWQTQIIGARDEDRFVLVGEIDGEVAGWLTGGACRDNASGGSELGEVHGCYVDPAHWRQGVGSALMAVGLERLSRNGYTQAVLWVLADNPRARAFYEQHGWLADGASKYFEVAGERYLEVRYGRCLP
jgi:GNAT superfamily N-acetyltransferase